MESNIHEIDTPQNGYRQTRDALEFLYEEAIRNKSYDMAQILLQALACCEQLLDETYKPAISSPDAVNCLNFVRSFLELDDDKKQKIAQILGIGD